MEKANLYKISDSYLDCDSDRNSHLSCQTTQLLLRLEACRWEKEGMMMNNCLPFIHPICMWFLIYRTQATRWARATWCVRATQRAQAICWVPTILWAWAILRAQAGCFLHLPSRVWEIWQAHALRQARTTIRAPVDRRVQTSHFPQRI